ncbi:MOSC domain-containing protein [Brevibacterium sp. JSBI002]|uniref:MOSC domain-containing protein n=1 Tax=Brevibacterium sp. JSBI002 TaxID=2886045 RepID=UPI0022314565|nr:2Fe-2S iron-sulfur cluster-binding protein [Brevibacterium sp. JSBI002]UZD62137.1 2Fe-2S iron-sulfur cluster-binding protein [Brevibacterium sp. JSBI002]
MRVARLFRFPVKGFPAEELTEARVIKDRGIRGDRIAAFTNGSLDVPADAWHSYSAFTVLKNDTDLQKWQVAATLPEAVDAESVPGPDPDGRSAPAEAADDDSATVTLTAPTGESTCFSTDDEKGRAASASFLSERIPPQGTFPRCLAVADQGMFDSQRSGISLINPATVAAIADTDEGRAALGLSAEATSPTVADSADASVQDDPATPAAELDPLRFRGNILVDGLAPFEEFALIGSIIRLGGVRLAIRSTIERCPATTVNPTTTEVDVNVPRLLNSACGHLHCGIYGQILETGDVAAGDEITVEGPAPRELVKVARTPRFMTVVGRRQICNDIVEVALRDDLGWIREFDEPGTNLRVHLDLGAPFWRTYTITDVDDDIVRIAVRTQGKGSRAMASLEEGQRVLTSGPHGTMTASRVFGGTTALITAGIGITPSLGLLRSDGLADLPATERIRLFHVDRDHRTACLWNRLQDRAHSGRVPVETHHRDTATAGRPGHRELVDWVAGCDNVMVCGPRDFTAAVLAAADEAGVPAVHQETFASPNTGMSEAIAACSPAEVTLENSGTSFVWEPKEGTLLESLEARGFCSPSSCRGGSCGTCSVPLAAGSVLYPIEPAARVENDEVLVCSAVPAGPISLAL